MERNYKVGDIVRIEMKTGVFQIVAENEQNTVYVRRIFDSKLNFRLGKAVFYDKRWLHGMSKEFEKKIGQILSDNPEIAQQVNDIKLDPEFNYCTWFFKKQSTFYIVKNDNLVEINKIFDDKLQNNLCDKQLIKVLKYLQKKKLVFPVTTRLTSDRQGLKDDECVCRIECGRYETDFDEKGAMTFRRARLHKINMGVSKIKADNTSPIGFIV